MEKSVEQLVRDVLDQAYRDQIVRGGAKPQYLSSGDLVGCANIVAEYLRERDERKQKPAGRE